MPEDSKCESEESSLGGSPPTSSSNLSVSLGSTSRCSSVSSHDGFVQFERQFSQSSDRSLSEKEYITFSPAQYLKMHKQALAERARLGSSSRRMKSLYRWVMGREDKGNVKMSTVSFLLPVPVCALNHGYHVWFSRVWYASESPMLNLLSYWMDFLQDNFNDAMFQSFVTFAQEDAAQGDTQGLCYLFKYFKKALMISFEAEHYVEFEQLAHRYHDYMDFDYGIRCLVELLTMGGQEAASAVGHTLAPATIVLLEAWQAHMDRQAALDKESVDPRLKLHKHLAEKRKSRSKARCNRSAKDDNGGVAATDGEPVERVPHAQAAPSSSIPHQRNNRGGAPPKTAAQVGCKAFHKAKSIRSYPQAQPQVSLSPQARGLPDRLGDFLGN